MQDYSPATHVCPGGDLSDVYFYQTELFSPRLASGIQAPATSEKKKFVSWCGDRVPFCLSTVKLQPKGLQHNGDQYVFDKWFLLN